MAVNRRKGEDWHDFHDRVIRSKHWRDFRKRVLQAWGHTCAMNKNLKPSSCSGALDVHHRTYDNLGNEDFFDVAPFCRKHHELLHAEIKALKGKKKKRGKLDLLGGWF